MLLSEVSSRAAVTELMRGCGTYGMHSVLTALSDSSALDSLVCASVESHTFPMVGGIFQALVHESGTYFDDTFLGDAHGICSDLW